MRRLFWILLGLAIVWCVYWFVGATILSQGAKSWLEERRSDGWAADANVKTIGFPLNFSLQFSELRLADPSTAAAITMDKFELKVPAWAPTRATAVFPNEFLVFSPQAELLVRSNNLSADLHLALWENFQLKTTGIAMENLQISGPDQWQMEIESGFLRMSQLSDAPQMYTVDFQGRNFRPGKSLKSIIDRDDILPNEFAKADLNAIVSFDVPWDRFSIEQARPQPTNIKLSLAQAIWGQLELKMAGAFAVDNRGVPEGDITIKAVNWRDMLQLGLSSGAIPPNTAQTLEGLLTSLARASGPPNTLDMPITLSGGQMRFGFIPLGAAPRFYLQ